MYLKGYESDIIERFSEFSQLIEYFGEYKQINNVKTLYKCLISFFLGKLSEDNLKSLKRVTSSKAKITSFNKFAVFDETAD